MAAEVPKPLGEFLEGEASIRASFRELNAITRWPKGGVGIPSVKSMRLNRQALELVATWWTSLNATLTVIPIHTIRDEVSMCRQVMTWENGLVYFFMCSVFWMQKS